MSNLTFGHAYLVTSFETRAGHGAKAPRGKFKTPAGQLAVMLYLGPTVAGEPFTADGALAALGYGPQLFTRKTRALIDALEAARRQLADLAASDENLDEVLAQIDAALAGAQPFKVATDAPA